MKRFNFHTLLILLLVVLFTVSAGAAKKDFQINKLSNGLTVITKEIHFVPVTSLYVFYKVGSVNEYGQILGISHIVEHMMFKGTKNFGPNDIDKLIKSVGGSHNAYTSNDLTAYYINLPSNAIDIGLMIEADRMENSRMAASDFKTERFVIMEERRMRTDNSPFGTFWERYSQVVFSRHPYRNPVIGYMSDIEVITIDQIKEYYKKYYQPNNAAVIVVGDFKTSEMLKKVKKHFGGIKKGPDIPELNIPQEIPKGERVLKIKDVRNKYHVGYYSYRIPTYDSEDFAALQAIPMIMSRVNSARLQKLVDQGIALGTSAIARGGRDPRTMIFILYSKTEQELMQCEKLLFEEIEKLKTELVSDLELKIAKNTLDSDFVFSYQSASNIAEKIGYFHTVADLNYLTGLRDDYRDLTKEDIKRVAVKYLKKDYVIKGYLFPDTSGKTAPPPPQSSISGDSHGKTYNKDLGSKVDLKKYITAESDYKVELKNKIKRKVLPNGVIVVAMQNPNFDIVAVKGTLLAGPAFDKKGKFGLATLTVSCLGYGTTTRDKQKIDEEKDLISLRGDIDTGLETVTFKYSMVSNQYDSAMALVSDFIINPTFPEKYFNQQKMSFLMYHQQLTMNPQEVVGKTFKKLLYGEEHPYSHYQYGDAAEFNTFTLDDVKQFHKDNYGPEHCIIGVVGPQSPTELIGVIEKYFGKWAKTGKVNKVDFGDMKPLTEIKEKSISLPGQTQTNIRMGWPGVKVGEEDYYPLMILNFVMGGGSLSSRLGSEIRVKSGLAYSVHSYIHPRTFKGSINIVTGTKAGNEELVRKKIIKVIKEIIKNGISDEELFISKQYMINSSPRSMETNGQLVGSIEYMEYMKLGMDYYDNYTAKIKKVTSEDIKRVAKKYLDTEKYIWVQVGP